MKLQPKRVLRISTYALLATVIIYLTVVLVAIGQGYKFDWRTGGLTSGGLALVDSQPAGARVEIDGKAVSKTTPLRLSLTAGEHHVQVTKEGFYNWQKQIVVNPAEVSWLKYLLLVPQSLTIEEWLPANGISDFQQSPDRRWLSLVFNSKSPSVGVVEIGRNELQTVYEMPASLVKQKARITELKWANDNSHLLLTIKSAQSTSHLIINTRDRTEVIDLELEFKIKPAVAQFSFGDWQQLYVQVGSQLLLLNVADRADPTQMLLRNIRSFQLFQDEIFALQDSGSVSQIVRLANAEAMPEVVIGSLKKGNYQYEHIAYVDKKYLAILNPYDKTVSLYDPTSQSQQSLGRFDTVSATNIFSSPDDRYLVMQQANHFANFDFEEEKLHRFDIKGQLGSSKIGWFDNFHMLGYLDGQLQLWEFDGHNRQKLVKGLSQFSAFASRDRQFVYYLQSDSQGQPHLSRFRLVGSD